MSGCGADVNVFVLCSSNHLFVGNVFSFFLEFLVAFCGLQRADKYMTNRSVNLAEVLLHLQIANFRSI